MAAPKRKRVEAAPLEIDGVPTVAGLVRQKLANPRQVRHGKSTHTVYHVTPEGHALMGQKLRENARRSLEQGIWNGVSGSHPGPPPQPGYEELREEERT